MYRDGQGDVQDYEEAVRWFRVVAEQGDVRAQYNLGVMYDHGNGVPQDYERAVQWYRAAAEQGYAEAQYYLGLMYEGGEGVAQDIAEAYAWMNAAAAQGRVDAMRTREILHGRIRRSERERAKELAREYFEKYVTQ